MLPDTKQRGWHSPQNGFTRGMRRPGCCQTEKPSCTSLACLCDFVDNRKCICEPIPKRQTRHLVHALAKATDL